MGFAICRSGKLVPNASPLFLSYSLLQFLIGCGCNLRVEMGCLALFVFFIAVVFIGSPDA